MRGPRLWPRLSTALVLWLALAGAAAAQDRMIRVSVEGAAAQALLEHLAPRFKLKTRIAVEIAAAAANAEADVLIAPLKTASEGAALFRRESMVFAGLAVDGPRRKSAQRFLNWMASPPGRHAIETFEPEDGVAFSPDLAETVETAAVRADAAPEALRRGEELAFRRCGRCHVIGERNKFGGIGSTPSFPALRGFDDWRDRFETFWSLRPHPSFTQIEDVTPPFDPRFPPAVMPLELTMKEVEAIVAYVTSIPPKRLGAPIRID